VDPKAIDGDRLLFQLTVTDGGGLQDDARCTITVQRSQPQDTTAPSVAISTPTTAAAFSTEADRLDLSGSAADPSGVVKVTWQTDHGASGTAEGTTSWAIGGVPLPLGDTRVQVTALDGAGNSASATLTVTRTALADTQAPVLTLLAPTTGDFLFTKRGYVSLSGTASDNDRVSKVTWTYANGNSGTADGTENWSIPRISLKKWFSTITITAEDPAGNTTTKTLTVLRWGW
jgi:hypothetical protein